MTPAMKALIALIVGMGIAIMAALVLVAYGLLAGFGEEPAGFGARDLEVPPGCAIAEARLEDDLMVIRLTGAADGCEQVVLIDPASGAERGRIVARPGPP